MNLSNNQMIILAIFVVLMFIFLSGGSVQLPLAEPVLTPAQHVMSGKPVVHDLGMYDIYNPNAFGTTKTEDARKNNDGVRREYHYNSFPVQEGCSGCAQVGFQNGGLRGVTDPAISFTHVCKGGFPSKRIIDMYGSNTQLPHICAPAGSFPGGDEPTQLGRWFKRKGCSSPEGIGLNVRPGCTRCGN